MLAAGRWLWERPVWAHVAVLIGLCLVVLPATRPGGSLISDEGAAALQARTLDRTGSWIIHAPLAQFDPGDRANPLPYVEVGPKGRAPYAKHPLYPVLLLGASKVAGRTGYYLLSILGSVLAAAGAWVLARRLGASARASFWVASIATPLWFYGFVLQAHSLGAAGAVAAVALAWSALERPSALRLGGLFLTVVFAVALRSEAVLFAGGLVLAALAIALLTGHSGRAALGVAAVATIAVGAVRLGERAFLVHVLGSGAGTNSVPSAHRGLFATPVRSFYSTWLSPTNEGSYKLGVALIVAIALVAAAGLLARQRGRDGTVVACLGAALACYIAWFVWAPAVPVEGLVLVFPTGWFALWSLTRADVETPARRFVGVAAVVFTAGVLLTQYPGGGGPEWGGRFFVLVLAVVAPLAVVVLGRAPRGVAIGVLAAALTVVLMVGAVRTLRETHTKSKQLLTALDNAGREARSPFGSATDPRPVVITTAPLVPQLLWEGYDRFRWLDPTNKDLPTYVQRLAAGGVRRVVLIPSDATKDVAAMGPWYREIDRPGVTPHRLPPNPVIVFEKIP